MTVKCSSCNAVVDEGMKLCPNCGRLLSSIGDRHEYQQSAPRRPRPPQARSSGQARHPAGSGAKRPVRQQPAQKKKPSTKKNAPPAEDEKALPGWTRLIKRIALIAALLAAIYFGLFGLQVLRIKHSSYEFDTQMKLTSSNYGEAFSSSVTDGSWSYNPFTFGMTYSGIHDGKEIEIRFSAAIEVKVKSIRVGNEEKTTPEQINNYLMGLFI